MGNFLLEALIESYVSSLWDIGECSMQQLMRYHGAKGSLWSGGVEGGQHQEEEDKLDVLVDANDQLLEKAVSYSLIHTTALVLFIIK